MIELSRRTWLTTACVVLVAGSAFAAAPVRKNTPPVAIIESPKDGTVYAAGATVLLAGKATDAEDPDSRLSYLWEVDAVHSGRNHVRVLSFNGKGTSFVPDPGDDPATVFEIRLVVTDSGQLRDTARVTLGAGGGGGAAVVADESMYPLGPGDKVHITVYAGGEKQQEFEADVSPAGTLTAPLVGEIPVRGVTAFEVSNRMRAILSRDYFVDPQVLVTVNEYARKVFVSGEVKNPGGYSVQEGLTVLSACTLAGGFTDYAAPNRVKVLRTERGKTRTIEIDLSKVRRGKAPDVAVMAGDHIDVPHRRY